MKIGRHLHFNIVEYDDTYYSCLRRQVNTRYIHLNLQSKLQQEIVEHIQYKMLNNNFIQYIKKIYR